MALVVVLVIGAGVYLYIKSSNIKDCATAECIAPKFSLCEPARFMSESPLGTSAYTIHGPKADGCEVTIKFTEPSSEEWVNKEMTCTLDNNIPIVDAFANELNAMLYATSDCKGSLVDFFHSE